MHNLLNSWESSPQVCRATIIPQIACPPREVTVLSPCSCWCLAPHASHIPSPHLDDTRCSWIISHTGESSFPLQLHLDLCYISSNSIQSIHVHAIFAQIFLAFKPLLQREEVKTLRDGHWRAFFPTHFICHPLKNKTLTWSWKVACLKCITMSRKLMAV